VEPYRNLGEEYFWQGEEQAKWIQDEENFMGAYTCNSSCVWGRGRRILAKAGRDKKQVTLSEKQTKAKRAGNMAQVVEYLLHKQEVFS
jgi:hypothetical protein